MANENDTQWESNNFNMDDDTAYEYGVSNDREYDDEDEYSSVSETGNSRSAKLFIIILIVLFLLIAIAGFFTLKYMNSSNKDATKSTKAESNAGNVNTAQNNVNNAFFNENLDIEEDYNMLNVDFSDNNASNITSNVDNNSVSLEENKVNSQNNQENTLLPSDTKNENELKEQSVNEQPVLVTWDDKGRRNPFKPIRVIVNKPEEKYETYGDTQFEIIEPPTKLVPDENLTKLLQTQISGILYDGKNPSAIVNLAGQDQFVKIGDEISGYRIKNITRTKVEISYNNNTYIASVGELFAPGKLDNESGIVNLNNKFGGRFKKENKEE